jgi:hypothetical protein
MIAVVRPMILALTVEHLDMRLQGDQRERVKGQQVLSVLCLAVRLDHLAVHDPPRDIDLKRAAARSRRSRRAPASSQRRMPEVASSILSAKNRSVRARCRNVWS